MALPPQYEVMLCPEMTTMQSASQSSLLRFDPRFTSFKFALRFSPLVFALVFTTLICLFFNGQKSALGPQTLISPPSLQQELAGEVDNKQGNRHVLEETSETASSLIKGGITSWNKDHTLLQLPPEYLEALSPMAQWCNN